MAQDVEDILKKDFRSFLYVVWKHLNLPDPTPVQYDIANYLQDSSIKRKIIEGYRGVGKSWITSAYVLWRLYKDPDYKALVVSASKTRSNDFTTFTKRLIKELPILNFLEPQEGQRDSMVAFDVGPSSAAHAPSVKSVGIFGQLTGSRAVEIIADDVEVAQNALTQDLRDKLLRAVGEFEAIIVPDVGQITYLGTPQTEESVYNKLRERGYDCRMWPARYPKPGDLSKYNGGLAPIMESALSKDPTFAGKPTDPLHFGHIDLMEREAAYGRTSFALQFMLDTSLSDADRYPLKTSDLVVMALNSDKAPISLAWSSGSEHQLKDIQSIGFTGDRWYKPMFIDEKWTEYEGAVMFIDPSGRGSDETGYAVVKQLHGYLFVTAAGGLKGGYDDHTLMQLACIARDNKVNLVRIEANFGDGMFLKIFQPVLTKVYPCSTEEIKVSIQKEKRIIDVLEPVMNRHRLIVDSELIRRDIKDAIDSNDSNFSLFYQLTRITKERGALKHDDRLDALSGAVGYWVEAVARDEKDAVSAYEQQLLEKELENFVANAVQGVLSNTTKPHAPNWINR